uniref:Uncharacterized protein n=1 Tax=Globisporangium ultimum (strain ATCC 200006 / CBS 805.95 / DAOM BR144) TaxID=431595 RepID=K3WNR8_GLOUD
MDSVDAAQLDFGLVAMDADGTLDSQFAAIAPITCSSTAAEACTWLSKVGEIMGRVALGGASALPNGAYEAVNDISSVIVKTDALLHNRKILLKVFRMTPSLWKSGYWYAPITKWRPALSSIWTKTVEYTKMLCDSGDSVPYNAAINATSLMIRFTKDNYFLNGEPDDLDTSDSKIGKAYLTYLPELVAQLSKVDGFTLTEAQLRAYMNSIPSKKDGMDTSVAFPVYVDTAKYKDSDTAALRAFLTQPTGAQQSSTSAASSPVQSS